MTNTNQIIAAEALEILNNEGFSVQAEVSYAYTILQVDSIVYAEDIMNELNLGVDSRTDNTFDQQLLYSSEGRVIAKYSYTTGQLYIHLARNSKALRDYAAYAGTTGLTLIDVSPLLFAAKLLSK